MSLQFEYGLARVKDLSVKTAVDSKGKEQVSEVVLNGRPVKPTDRFWNSLHLRFGFTGNIFKYFTHEEVFNRISKTVPNDHFRYCIEQVGAQDRLLAVTSPGAAMIRHDDLLTLLDKHDAEEVKYSDGYVRSKHAPRFGGPVKIGGDDFKHKFVIDTPIDGFGRPAVYLSMLRLICSNGAIGYSPAFRSELNVGRTDQNVTFALLRVLEGFNNEEGYAAMRQRFESATKSWASVGEVNKLYKTLTRLHSRGEVRGSAPMGSDGANEVPSGSPLFTAFHRMTGDLSHVYGLANLDALSAKRQRTLPTGCKVYDLLNFASEAATHHATAAGERALQSYLGELISGEYDLEGTVDHFDNWQDFFIGSEATASTMADMNRRGRSRT